MEYTESGVLDLCAAIYKQAAKDYKHALKIGKRGRSDARLIEDFLTSGAYGVKKEIGGQIIKEIRAGLNAR